MIHFRIRYEQLRARLEAGRRGTAFVHALSLALVPLLAAAVAWAAGFVGPLPWLWPAASLVVLALAWGVLARPRSNTALGEMLDRRFGLDELLVTALEVDRRGPESPLDVHLLDDAASALARIERDPALVAGDNGRAVETLAGVALVVAGAWLLAAAFGGSTGAARLPDLPAAVVGFGPGSSIFGQAVGLGGDSVAPDPAGSDNVADVAMRERPSSANPSRSAAGTGSAEEADQPGAPLPVRTAAATLSAAGEGSGAMGQLSGEGAGGAPLEGAVTGGGGRVSAAAAGGSLPWDHREAVRRYFAAP